MRSGSFTPRLTWASDRALLVRVGDGPGLEAHRRVVAALEALERARLPEVENLHPAYDSILVVVDPLAREAGEIERRVAAAVSRAGAGPAEPGRLVEIPVCYEPAYAPDLVDTAHAAGMSPEAFARRHHEADYHVAFLGFSPGFAYLLGLPVALRAPRLPSPRTVVPPGSVGIAGAQTGIYPSATPGGWRLIGRTPLGMFRAGREPAALLRAGDRVRFVPIDGAAFERIPREERG